MKKIILFLIPLLIFNACSRNNNDTEEHELETAIKTNDLIEHLREKRIAKFCKFTLPPDNITLKAEPGDVYIQAKDDIIELKLYEVTYKGKIKEAYEDSSFYFVDQKTKQKIMIFDSFSKDKRWIAVYDIEKIKTKEREYGYFYGLTIHF
ncbi:hypothetical protein GNY06_02975 [Elizabethkingia argentiflava]|uniref:Uncharacterized protein n=1 Tax=Elizabethkingia argenteiflava TaxID=2681556 RepID=A0A845PU09_9FLAO|nr:hypothetical protein [Elizabethkingia argenteiflava]NAW50396.1 hypothetical protein [Elizabethkingia argenteiflava]